MNVAYGTRSNLALGRRVILRQLLFAACPTFTKAQRPAQECISGVCRRYELQGSLTGSWMFWQRTLTGFVPSAAVNLGWTSARTCQTQHSSSATHLLSHHVPCRLRSSTAWYLWRSLLALIRSIGPHLLAEAVARMLISQA